MGEKVFGVTPFGWRFSSALAGTLIVTLVAVIAQLLFGSALWTFVAGLLLAVENLNVVLSRSALLDIHLEFWVVLRVPAPVAGPAMDRSADTPPEPEPEPARRGHGPERPDDRRRSRPGRSSLPIPLWRPWRSPPASRWARPSP